MNRDSHWSIITAEIEQSIATLLPHGAGPVTDTRLRHILTSVAQHAFREGESYALLSLLTLQDVATILGVSRVRAQKLARERHQRFGIGYQVAGTRVWLFRPEEVEALRPGPRSGGRPRTRVAEES